MNVYEEAVKKWGKDEQLDKLEEELAELLVELKHYRKGRSSKANLFSEMADVEICLRQMQYIFTDDIDDMNYEYSSKLTRLAERLDIAIEKGVVKMKHE